MNLSRDAAWGLVTAHTRSESLRKHMLGVEAAAWVHPSEIARQHMAEKAKAVIAKALQFPREPR